MKVAETIKLGVSMIRTILENQVRRPRVTKGPAPDVELRAKRVFECMVEVDVSFRLLVSFGFLRIVSLKVLRAITRHGRRKLPSAAMQAVSVTGLPVHNID
jgi:hypothetical protein